MQFASPIWLVGLGPWVGWALYLLRAKSLPASVPFLQLWGGNRRFDASTRAVRLPPFFLILLLVSVLLTIFAAAGPAVSLGRSNAQAITIILDRGMTMAPTDADSDVFRGVIPLAERGLGNRFDSGAAVTLLPIPGAPIETDIAHWAQVAKTLSPTMLDTQQLLEQTAADRIRQNVDPIIVLSDRKLDISDERLFQIPPAQPVNDIGIIDIAARTLPVSQVMVRLRNISAARTVALKLTSGNAALEQMIQLPPNGQTRDYFFDLSKLGDTLEASIAANDDLNADDRAWLVKTSAAPRLAALTPLPGPLERLINVYSRLHPPQASSRPLYISIAPLSDDQTGLVMTTIGDSANTTSLPSIKAHPLTENVKIWPVPLIAPTRLPDHFEPLVTYSDTPTLGIREHPKQIWFNAELDNWAKTPDFVIFFANAMDWLNETPKQQYEFRSVGQLGAGWFQVSPNADSHNSEAGLMPGLYRRNDAQQLAINAPDVQWAVLSQADWQTGLQRFSHSLRADTRLAPWCCVLALSLTLLAAMRIPV